MKMTSLFSNYLHVSNKTNWLYSVYYTLSYLVKDYPQFTLWYFSKVVPGILQGSRDIILYSLDYKLAGVSIIKKDNAEKKICTIRVFPEFRDQGIGKHLFEKSFELLKTEKPLITVSQSRLPQFERLFNYYGFTLSKVYSNLYMEGQNEYVFNGELFKKNSLASIKLYK